MVLISSIILFWVAPARSLAWVGGCHEWAAEASVNLFREGNTDPVNIQRGRETPLFPELELAYEYYDPDEGCCDDEDLIWLHNWQWVIENSISKDDEDDTTLHHFWDAEEGLYGQLLGADNAWMEAAGHWIQAVSLWDYPNVGGAYAHLGYAMHLIQDMGQPAHAHEDMHPGDYPIGVFPADDDSLEDWISRDYCRSTFHWDATQSPLQGGGNFVYGPVLSVPTNNNVILSDMLYPDSYWEGADEVRGESLFMSDGYEPYNMEQLFYIMYYVNQTGDYFASDDEDGSSHDPIGWLDGYPGWPTQLWNGDADEWVSIHNSDGLYGLYDNDGCDCDDDGDLSKITTWAYGGAFRAMPAVLNLFRRTVDAVPPDTVVEMTRVDGNPVVEWNNSPVTVQLTGAVDGSNPGWRASGTWKVWGLLDGVPPVDPDAPWWSINEDGIHELECLSTDMIGNVDTKDVTIKYDGTPPEIAFPDLKPLYLTSESVTATWVASDATSGLRDEYALLDGTRVDKGEVIDLALLAGLHRLEVYAEDFAGNIAYAYYDFEVVIDADGWCYSIIANTKTKGNALFCAVEFPAPYDVGLIDRATCTLEVNTSALAATKITGVGDHDEDLLPDRMLRFDKWLFMDALGGQLGDIPVEIWGGLHPDGLPRFVADPVVPVFLPPDR
jgi:hypothetical protein